MSELSETAVLCGNGSKAFKNAGNELFRHLVSVKKVRLVSSIFLFMLCFYSVINYPSFLFKFLSSNYG
jgi:hypothetical protein